MTDEEIFKNLCVYDTRNTDVDFDEDEIEDREKLGIQCYCDNCFTGRTKLALEILKLKQKNKK